MASEQTIEESQTNAPQTKKSMEGNVYFTTGDLAADRSMINTLTKIVPINELKAKAPFKDLFPISDKLYEEILVSMKENGYNPLYPIYYWQHDNEKIVLDGHTRLRAAKEAGMKEILAIGYAFDDETSALDFSFSIQKGRRNLTDADLYKYLTTCTERHKRGPREKSNASPMAKLGRSSEAVAQLFDVSHGKVEKARTVVEHAKPEDKKAVESGKMSINRAYANTMKNRRPVVPETQQDSPVTHSEHQIRVNEFKNLLRARVARLVLKSVREFWDLELDEKLRDEISSSTTTSIKAALAGLLGKRETKK